MSYDGIDDEKNILGWRVEIKFKDYEEVFVSRDYGRAKAVWEALIAHFGGRNKNQSGLSSGIVRTAYERGEYYLISLTRCSEGWASNALGLKELPEMKMIDIRFRN
jgi:hypothetical protein